MVSAPIDLDASAARLLVLACSDHHCDVARRGGMGTNGGCNCISRIVPVDERVRLREVLRLRRERDDALCARVRELERAHGNLLAVIHRDGGHYVSRYGWKQAAKDAERIVIAMRERVRELEKTR